MCMFQSKSFCRVHCLKSIDRGFIICEGRQCSTPLQFFAYTKACAPSAHRCLSNIHLARSGFCSTPWCGRPSAKVSALRRAGHRPRDSRHLVQLRALVGRRGEVRCAIGRWRRGAGRFLPGVAGIPLVARTGGQHQDGSKFDESRGAERSNGGEWKGWTDARNCCTPIGRVVIYLGGITKVLHVESYEESAWKRRRFRCSHGLCLVRCLLSCSIRLALPFFKKLLYSYTMRHWNPP